MTELTHLWTCATRRGGLCDCVTAEEHVAALDYAELVGALAEGHYDTEDEDR